MQIIFACLGVLLLMTEVASAEPAKNSTVIPGTRFAQSYCAMCGNERTSCVIGCNGSGACIQNCDNDYRLCVERACRR
jgi:hypothetical protein